MLTNNNTEEWKYQIKKLLKIAISQVHYNNSPSAALEFTSNGPQLAFVFVISVGTLCLLLVFMSLKRPHI